MEPPATGPTAGLSACSDTEKPLPEALVAPFKQTPQQRERSRLVPLPDMVPAASLSIPGIIGGKRWTGPAPCCRPGALHARRVQRLPPQHRNQHLHHLAVGALVLHRFETIKQSADAGLIMAYCTAESSSLIPQRAETRPPTWRTDLDQQRQRSLAGSGCGTGFTDYGTMVTPNSGSPGPPMVHLKGLGVPESVTK